MNIRQTKLVSLMAVAAVLSACASQPERNSALDQAHNRYNVAAADPQVSSLAAAELQSAATTLREADKAWRDGGSTDRIDQMAYLSSQRVSIALDTAASRAAQAITANAAAERDRLRLAMRTNEADTAKAQLVDANTATATANAAAATADAATAAAVATASENAERDQARVERRDARLIEMQAQLQELQARKTDRGMVVTLGDVLFDSGKSALLPASQRHMDKLATFFKNHPDQRATIEGYTDSVGSMQSNQDLSERRAQSVMSALVGLGVAADHLNTRAFGEEEPVSSNATSAGRQQNRRVEILFAPPRDEVSQR